MPRETWYRTRLRLGYCRDVCQEFGITVGLPDDRRDVLEGRFTVENRRR